jgi:transposase-like protein
MMTPKQIDQVRQLCAAGVEQREIARRMGMNLNTLKARLHRAGYRLSGGSHVIPIDRAAGDAQADASV